MRQPLRITLLVGLSVAILVGMASFVGLRDITAALADAGPIAFIAVGVAIWMQVVLQAGAWAVLNDGAGQALRFPSTFLAVTAATAVNIVTPSSYLGGEPVKALIARQKTGLRLHEVAGTVLLTKYLEVVSFLLVFGTCTVIAACAHSASIFGNGGAAATALVAVGAGLFALCTFLWISLVRRWHPLARVVGVLRRLRPHSSLLKRTFTRTVRMERNVSRLYREQRGHTARAFVLLLFACLAIVVRPLAFFAFGPVEIDAGALCLMFITSQVLVGLQVTPSGAGTLDGGMVAVFALLGLDAAGCLAYLVCVRMWDASIVGVGFMVTARGTVARVAPANG